ncbi:class I SAM-dependent methyltransferase [Alteribacter aurantiacus]|uniref:class I SAM-dependent methyltransferase n=1 Tax=Alteribacter aurantiacus TaxID=254410 RepID=UPI000403FCA0|nr:class I SAM-dependent methyltransferase [Alteribacter aurantiacus]
MENIYTYTDMLAFFGVTVAHPGGTLMTERATDLIPISPGMKIADIGCGLGDTARFLASEKDAIVYGIDAHPLMIQKARQRHQSAFDQKKLHFLHTDASHIPFPDHSMNVIIAESVLSFTNVHDVLKECKRLLRPGGFFASLDLVCDPTFPLESKEEYGTFYGMKQLFTVKEWHDLLRSYNMDVQYTLEEDPLTSPSNGDIPELLLSDDVPLECYEMMENHIAMLENNRAFTRYAYFICKKDDQMNII